MPRPTPTVRRGRPRQGELPRDAARSVDSPSYRRRLAAEMPELPRRLADEADLLDLALLAAVLLPPPTRARDAAR